MRNDVPVEERAGRLPGVMFAVRYPSAIGYAWTAVIRTRDMAAGLLKQEAAARIAYPRVDPVSAYQPEWLEVDELDLYDTTPARQPAIAECVRRHNIRVIVYMSASGTEIDMRFLRGLGVRLLTTENNGFDERARQPFPLMVAKTFVRGVLRRQVFDAHIPVSKGQLAFLRRFARYPADALRLNRHGVDTSRFAPGDRAAACAALDLDPRRLWILSASQARQEKRGEMLIDAASELARRHGDAVGFLFAGDGPCLPEWRAKAARAGLADSFRFLGYQSDMAPIFRAASIFAHASSVEAFGLVVLEAMSTGMPAVATWSHGPAEIIQDGETGYVVGRDDSAAFVNRLSGYVADPALLAAHGKAARARAVAEFSLDREASILADIIREFL